MIMQKRGLGKGLSTLLGDALTNTDMAIQQLPIAKVTAGQYQPRRHFSAESLAELKQSIQAHGIIQPIVVRPLAHDRYEIIAGERRFRAAKMANLTEVPVVIKKISDEATLAMALIENIQREDLQPLEQAKALKQLQQQFNLTHEQIAKNVGKSRVAVTHLLGLLTLPTTIQQYLHTNQLELGHAKLLMALPLPRQLALATQIVAKKLSVREAEKLIAQTSTSNQLQKIVEPNIAALNRRISEKLNTLVTIQHQTKGNGKLIIHYRNVDSLQNLLSIMHLMEDQ